MGEKLVEEKIKIQVKDFTCKIKGKKNVKHESHDPGSGVSIVNGKLCTRDAESHTQTSEIPPTTSNSTADKRSGGRKRRSPTYYSFEDTSPDSLTTAPQNKSTQSW